MTLRSRLVAAAVAVTLLLATLMAAMVVRQRSVLLDQVDGQLRATVNALVNAPIAAIDPSFLAAAQGVDAPRPVELYVGLNDTNLGLMVLAQPVTVPDFELNTDDPTVGERLTNPQPISDFQPFTMSGATEEIRARVAIVEVSDTRSVIAALPIDRVDEAQNQLIVTSILAVLVLAAIQALALWWVDRLGLQPISRLTTAAEDVAAGRSDRRVTHPPTTTEAGRLGEAFNTMLDARQAADDRQRRFIADASHELRTPLTTLRGYAALHQSGGLSDEAAVADAMRRINGEADRMSALVEDMLTLASLDEHRPLEISTIDLTRLLTDIASDAQAVQPDRAIDADGVTQGLVVQGDANLLTQALTAVTSNALRHTTPDAGLTINAARNDQRVSITVADQGPGRPADKLPKLFDRFYRVDTGRASAVGGRGLGLSITKTVIEAHEGTVNARSTPGSGTSIVIDLPIEDE